MGVQNSGTYFGGGAAGSSSPSSARCRSPRSFQLLVFQPSQLLIFSASHLPIFSTSYLLNFPTSPHHSVTLLPCHSVTLQPCHPVTLSLLPNTASPSKSHPDSLRLRHSHLVRSRPTGLSHVLTSIGPRASRELLADLAQCRDATRMQKQSSPESALLTAKRLPDHNARLSASSFAAKTTLKRCAFRA